MPALKNSILDTIGNTPVVRINNLGPHGVDLYAKLEAFNPLGSVKDRIAREIIETAERSGRLRPGQTVIEATSGNTGIGLACVCAQKGYPLVVVMAENFSVERRKLLRFLGAKVVLTPASGKGSGMLEKAAELAARHGWFLCSQFSNRANADAHARTTAIEILDDFGPGGLDYFVTGLGTGGTMKGIASVLRKRSPATRIIACEPENSPMLSSGLTQKYHRDGRPLQSHPAFRPHPMQGWSPDFIPKLAADCLRSGLIDEIVPVSGDDALHWAKRLACGEGIFCGISGGATFGAAMAIARKAPKGSRILAMIPDTGERYLSTPLFADVQENMSAEEIAISASTPGYQFGEPAKSAGPVRVRKAGSAQVPPDRAGLQTLINDAGETVLMFGLEWCEFCWSVRRFFNEAAIPFQTINLDSADYRKNDRGGALRAALRDLTRAATLPQIFIAGRHVGGASDVLAAFDAGTLQPQLAAARLPFRVPGSRKATSFLPSWVHPR